MEVFFSFSSCVIKMSARLISGGAACLHPAKDQRVLQPHANLAHFYAMCVGFTSGLIINFDFPYKAAHPLMLTCSAVGVKHVWKQFT